MNDEPVSWIRLAEPVEDLASHERRLRARGTIAHFDLRRRIGAGGDGIVFEARDVALDRDVALKIMRAPGDAVDAARPRFLREARALAALHHPNVVTVYESGVAEPDAFIAMELVRGPTLRAWIREPRRWTDVVDVFAGVGRGLAAIHALGLVHRDVKPANVFLDGRGVPKIGDFGLAVPIDELDDAVAGTPGYMAPELAYDHRFDALADQYSFCASLHEAIAGAVPGERPTRPVPEALRSILARGLSPAPALRFPSMPALLVALRDARRRGPVELARRWFARLTGPAVRRRW